MNDIRTLQDDLSWNLPKLITDLKNVRQKTHLINHNISNGSIYILPPSSDVLENIVKELIAALFPRQFGSYSLTNETEDYFVSHKLFIALSALKRQVLVILDYMYPKTNILNNEENHEIVADKIIHAFSKSLPKIRKLLDKDLIAAFSGDPAANCIDEVLLCYPSIKVMFYHRLSHELYNAGIPLIPNIISQIAHSKTGIDIHPGALIGSGFFIDHGSGVVIGETTLIGERVRIHQSVTLKEKYSSIGVSANLMKEVSRHPIIEDDVVIYAGATIFGKITVGRGSTIGGNVCLTQSVPPNSIITQASFIIK